MNVHTLVARNVRKLRVKRGLSQENLAVDAQIGSTHMNGIERGVANPTIDMLARLAMALNVSVADFFIPLAVGEKPPRPLPSGRRPKK